MRLQSPHIHSSPSRCAPLLPRRGRGPVRVLETQPESHPLEACLQVLDVMARQTFAQEAEPRLLNRLTQEVNPDAFTFRTGLVVLQMQRTDLPVQAGVVGTQSERLEPQLDAALQLALGQADEFLHLVRSNPNLRRHLIVGLALRPTAQTVDEPEDDLGHGAQIAQRQLHLCLEHLFGHVLRRGEGLSPKSMDEFLRLPTHGTPL